MTSPERPDPVAAAFERHADPVFCAAWHLLGDRAQAEDVLQEAFVALLQQEVLPGSLRGWLLAVALNRVRDRLRRRRPELLPELDEAAPDEASPPALVSGQERHHLVAAALATLPLPQREVVVLHAFEDLSFRAIGELCGISADTAASRWRYGCDRLRRHLLRHWTSGELR